MRVSQIYTVWVDFRPNQVRHSFFSQITSSGAIATVGTACIATAATQTEPDRNSLPVPEPQTKQGTVLDVRNATPPEATPT